MRYLLFLFICVMGVPTSAGAQQIEGLLDTLGMILAPEVKSGSNIYRQEIIPDTDNPCRVQFRKVTIDRKGRMTTEDFFFSASDVDLDALQVEDRRNSYYLEVPMLRGQYLVEYYVNQVPQNFLRSFNIMAADAIGAKRVEFQLRKLPDPCEEAFEQSNNFEEAGMEQLLDWLVANVGDVQPSEGKIEQTLMRRDFQTGAGLVMQRTVTDARGRSETEVITLNAGDLDGAGAEVKVRGQEVQVEVPVFARQRFVQKKDAAGKSRFENSFTVRVNSVEEGRTMVGVFERLAPLAEAHKKERMANLGEVGNALSKLSNMRFQTKRGGTTLTTSMDGDCYAHWTIRKGEGERDEFFAYLQDMEDVDMEVGGGMVNVILRALDGNRYVELRSNGERRGFSTQVTLPVDDIESGRILVHLIKQALEACRTEPMEVPGDGPGAFVDYLEDGNGKVMSNRGPINQQFDAPGEDERCELTLTQRAENRETGTTYVFDLSDVNPESVQLYISGKDIAVDLSTERNQNLIKVREEDEEQELVSSLRIWAKDLQDARRTAYALQAAAVGCLDN